jgi:hypothetical protein
MRRGDSSRTSMMPWATRPRDDGCHPRKGSSHEEGPPQRGGGPQLSCQAPVGADQELGRAPVVARPGYPSTWSTAEAKLLRLAAMARRAQYGEAGEGDEDQGRGTETLAQGRRGLPG